MILYTTTSFRTTRILAKVGTLPNRKSLLENPPETLIIDVTEQPIERPIKGQKQYYSGKKKQHTIKIQIFASSIGKILSVECTKGKQHDFSIFKRCFDTSRFRTSCRFWVSRYK